MGCGSTTGRSRHPVSAPPAGSPPLAAVPTTPPLDQKVDLELDDRSPSAIDREYKRLLTRAPSDPHIQVAQRAKARSTEGIKEIVQMQNALQHSASQHSLSRSSSARHSPAP
eukprot:gnl/Spiro4/13301_TR7070_c0_g1_i1.p1 gnl/Spiro4/13301_TR7070_c0_g1~~gnl/Spiro4/13301_TR7070_c0_g1_i1.p1  ORF type:complete len:112 (+),score=17.60 gnl/Spiro4/13301_TR7070_c0_g1_i1:111-446(+)